MKTVIQIFLFFLFCICSYSLPAQMKISGNEHGPLVRITTLKLKAATLPNGVQLQYAEQGDADGEPVIFLHGITDSWHSFEKVLPLLPPSIYAIAISQRGHGDSDRPLAGYAPKDFAADVAGLMKTLKLKSAVIVGHSMGGMIAQQFALDYPPLTKAVVIISSAAYLKDNPGMPEFYDMVMKLNDPIDKAFMDGFQKATLAKPIDPAFFDLLVEESMKVPVQVFKAALAGLAEADYANELKKINPPVLLLWGSKDSFFSADNQQLLVKEIKNARLLNYEGTGHALHWEEPARFAADLLDFVNRL
jgi:pimeloyl-ACP methyl ester carboxylesterase